MKHAAPDNDLRPLGDPGSDAFQVRRYPFFLLNRVVSRYNVIVEAQLRRIGLDIPSWRVLMVLGERAPRSVSHLAETCVINLSTLMRVLQRMERGGLVKRAPNPLDGRVTEVWLAEAGRKKLVRARASTAPIYAGAIAGFTAAEFAQMNSLLDRLFTNLDAVAQAESPHGSDDS